VNDVAMRWSAGQTFILATITSSHSAHEFLNSVHDSSSQANTAFFFLMISGVLILFFCYLIIQQMDALSMGFLH